MINQIWFTFGDLLVNCLPDPSSSKQGGPEVGTWSWHRHCDGCSCPMGLECCCLLYKSNTGKHAALQSRWWQSPGSNGMQNYDNFDNLVKSFDETSFSDLADVWCMEVCFWCPIFGACASCESSRQLRFSSCLVLSAVIRADSCLWSSRFDAGWHNPFPCLACWEPNSKCRPHHLLWNMMQSRLRRSCPASFLDFWMIVTGNEVAKW